ncbi:MAG: hypothetical protein MSC45_02450 [Mobiluncus sp.]|uniref:hypothetical protein n=1 Tax=Mobiluncus sp. TaxID=47293 RepID=UPI0025884DF2|nr:hypothetical protein [Mobiluncus sp.]MCI6583916.1 hypothetical protein [Mobiluncus sp.]
MTNQTPQPNNQFGGQPMPGQPMPNQPMQPAYQQEGPQDSTVMVLGIIGIFVAICAFIGWYIGSKAQKDALAQGQQPSQKLKTWTTVSKVVSIIWIVLLVLYVLFFVVMAGLIAASIGAGM